MSLEEKKNVLVESNIFVSQCDQFKFQYNGYRNHFKLEDLVCKFVGLSFNVVLFSHFTPLQKSFTETVRLK
jgi:hypothetical protein